MGDCKRMAVMDSSTADEHSPSKRRKILAASPPQLPPTMLHQLRDSHNFKLLFSTNSCSDSCSDEHSPPSSCCSSNEFNDVVFDSSPLLDLEAKSCETVYSTPANNKFRETTPSSELSLEDSEEMDSPAVSVRQRPPAVSKVPPSDEIEEFFATAEKYELKRFAEKYNFDTVKDAPLEGRYQWIRLKP